MFIVQCCGFKHLCSIWMPMVDLFHLYFNWFNFYLSSCVDRICTWKVVTSTFCSSALFHVVEVYRCKQSSTTSIYIKLCKKENLLLVHVLVRCSQNTGENFMINEELVFSVWVLKIRIPRVLTIVQGFLEVILLNLFS